MSRLYGESITPPERLSSNFHKACQSGCYLFISNSLLVSAKAVMHIDGLHALC